MAPGDALLFHGDLMHATTPNTSERRRCAVQLHYASGRCRPCRCADEARGATMRAPNPLYPGAQYPPAQGGETPAAGFDCAPEATGGEAGPCVEPQYWYSAKRWPSWLSRLPKPLRSA